MSITELIMKLHENSTLLEGKDAPVYHFTRVDLLPMIGRANFKLKGFKAGTNYDGDNRGRVSSKEVISVTRNPRFNFGSIRFKLDQAKIAQRYKIKPYQEEAGDRDASNLARAGAMEEVIVAKELELLKYCTEIELVPSTRDGHYAKVVKELSKGGFKRNYMNAVGSKSDITLSSVETEVCYILSVLVNNGVFKAGPNLAKILNIDPMPDYVQKYIKLASLEAIPKKNEADPKVENSASGEIIKQIENLGYKQTSNSTEQNLVLAKSNSDIKSKVSINFATSRLKIQLDGEIDTSIDYSDLEDDDFDVFDDEVYYSKKLDIESNVSFIVDKVKSVDRFF